MSYSLIKSVSLLTPTIDGKKPKLTIPYLSPSQIASFNRCEAAYYASYAKNRKEPQKPVMLLGTATHRFAEKYHELSMAGKSRSERIAESIQAAHTTIDATLRDEPNFQWDEPVWYKANTYAQGIVLPTHRHNEDTADSVTHTTKLLRWRLAHAIRALLPELDKYEPIRLEQGYFIKWADNITLPIVCFTDLIAYSLENGRQTKFVIDYKTSGKAKTATDIQRNIGLTSYSIGEGLTSGDSMIADVAFINVITTKKMTVTTLKDRRLPDDIRRLYNAARVQTFKLRAGLISPNDSGFTCADCYHKTWCEAEFGGMRPTEQEQQDANQLQLVA